MASNKRPIDRILAKSIFDLSTTALGSIRCSSMASVIQNNVVRGHIKTDDLDGRTLVRKLLRHLGRRIKEGPGDNDKDETGKLLSESNVKRLTDIEIESFSRQIYLHNTWLFEIHGGRDTDSSTGTTKETLPKNIAERDSDYLARALRVHMTESDARSEKLLKRLRNAALPLRRVEATISRLQKNFDQVDRLFKPAVDFHAQIESALEPLRRFSEQMDRSTLASKRMTEIFRANQNWQHLIDKATAPSRLVADLARVHPTWLRDLKSVQDQAAAIEVSAKLSLGKMAYQLTVSERMFAHIDVRAISQSTALPENAMSRLSALSDDMTATYRKLTESFPTFTDIIHLPKFVLPSATREVFVANHAVDRLDERDEAESEQDLAGLALVKESIEETSNCPALLTAVDPQLARMYEGARDALSGDNPDRSRHILGSLRELLNHLLRRIAPDESVLEWIPGGNGNWLHQGKPTRKARLRYLCRGIDAPPMCDFVVADTKAMVEFIEIFNRVHQLKIELSSQQLHALLHRTASFVTFVVTIWKETNK